MDPQSHLLPHLSRLQGPRARLAIPNCMLAHLAQPDARAQEADDLANWSSPYEGFEFGTFQIVEHDARTVSALKEVSEFADWPAPDLEWRFVFPTVLDAFFAAGLDETDVQMYLQWRDGRLLPGGSRTTEHPARAALVGQGLHPAVDRNDAA